MARVMFLSGVHPGACDSGCPIDLEHALGHVGRARELWGQPEGVPHLALAEAILDEIVTERRRPT